MPEFQWRSYHVAGQPQWIDRLDAPNRIRSALKREVRRLNELVTSGKWFGPDVVLISQQELADLRHDLDLWNDPEQVLLLLRSDAAAYISGLGPKSRKDAIEAVERLVTQ
jgi:hypothetical protein